LFKIDDSTIDCPPELTVVDDGDKVSIDGVRVSPVHDSPVPGSISLETVPSGAVTPPFPGVESEVGDGVGVGVTVGVGVCVDVCVGVGVGVGVGSGTAASAVPSAVADSLV
jgi:hypothetical protein